MVSAFKKMIWGDTSTAAGGDGEAVQQVTGYSAKMISEENIVRKGYLLK